MKRIFKKREFHGELRVGVRLLVLSTGVCFGLAIGLGVYTFYYAKGGSYLTNDSRACANCHIMEEHYSAWTKSSHHSVASCNDCHTPKGFLPKYLSKASNGFWHSLAFTTNRFHEPIRIKPHNRAITEQACRKCHNELVHDIDVGFQKEKVSCIHCHRSVGHYK